MGTITPRKLKNNKISYRVQIRSKGCEEEKTFLCEEDAKIYLFYKEKLENLTKNFDIPLKKRIYLEEIFEMKISTCSGNSSKGIGDFKISLERFLSVLPNKYYDELTYDDWLGSAKKLMEIDVFRGGKNQNCKRKPSKLTIRRYFACASSCVSYAQSQGLELENVPMKVLTTFINPIIKNDEI